jgi:glyoxylase-like metal-dependent hydrolase (beta-lactamase superfamily II)
MKTPEVIVRGKDNGEGMVIRHKTSLGTDVFGLAIPNIYAHSDWDLGPTWCYLIAGRKTTLIDTGRLGNFEIFVHLLKSTSKKITDIDRVVVTHSHEDHDGNLAEIVSASGAELVAHELYKPMISYHPDTGDGVPHPEFPGSCRYCPMPEKVYESCLPYHRRRSLLKVDIPIDDNRRLAEDNLIFIFSPGHAPDSICIVLEDEVIFTGDTVLPDITSQPTIAVTYRANRSLLPEKYSKSNSVYGLMNFIKSLSKIARLRSQPFAATFPGHRLFYEGRFNLLDAGERASEIISFHIERCRNILEIIGDRPTSIEEIVVRHFPPSRLTGMGKTLAENEIRAHLEVMKDCNDVVWSRGSKDVVEPTGSRNCLDTVASYLSST